MKSSTVLLNPFPRLCTTSRLPRHVLRLDQVCHLRAGPVLGSDSVLRSFHLRAVGRCSATVSLARLWCCSSHNFLLNQSPLLYPILQPARAGRGLRPAATGQRQVQAGHGEDQQDGPVPGLLPDVHLRAGREAGVPRDQDCPRVDLGAVSQELSDRHGPATTVTILIN